MLRHRASYPMSGNASWPLRSGWYRPLFLVMRQFSQRPPDPSGQPWMTPHELCGVVAHDIRNTSPSERDTRIRQRKLDRSEPALVAIITNAEVELPDAVFMQRSHRPFDDEQTRGAA